jgi:quaternary ammonium compound-resistance protein SugE
VAWVYLLSAGALEIVWASAMKQSDGFTNWRATLLMVVAMIFSFGLLTLAMRDLPLGVSYTIWTGIGAVGAFVVGIVVMGEAATALRLTAAGLIVVGMILMKLSSDH